MRMQSRAHQGGSRGISASAPGIVPKQCPQVLLGRAALHRGEEEVPKQAQVPGQRAGLGQACSAPRLPLLVGPSSVLSGFRDEGRRETSPHATRGSSCNTILTRQCLSTHTTLSRGSSSLPRGEMPRPFLGVQCPTRPRGTGSGERET